METRASEATAPPRSVLVLGGTGFVGSAIVAKYLASGSRVSVAARHIPDLSAVDRLGQVTFHCCDAHDREPLEAALNDSEHVVYALGTPFAGKADADPIGNVMATMPALLNVLESLRDRPGVGLTFLSSGGTVYGNPSSNPVPETAPCRPITGYGVMKVAAEHYLEMYRTVHGVPSRVLRIANAYGSNQPSGRGQGLIAELFRAARNHDGVTIFGDGEAVRDYVAVEDVATAVVALSGTDGGPSVVNVGAGKGHSINQVLDAFEAAVNVKIVRQYLPARGFDVRQVVLDVSRLTATIDWRPRPLRVGLRAAWENANPQFVTATDPA